MELSNPNQDHGKQTWSIALPAALLLLRLVIGWHFLYEGLAKLWEPNWSAAGYLASSDWALSAWFHWMAETSTVLPWVNFINIWGLILIGTCLMLGVCTRAASLAGALLLILYYVAHPPLIGMDAGAVAEGSYLIVNKNVVEMAALLLLAIAPSSGFAGLGRYIAAALRSVGISTRGLASRVETPLHQEPEGFSRRELVASLATLPVLGGFVYAVLKKQAPRGIEETALQTTAASSSVDSLTGPSVHIAQALTLDDLQEKVPHAKLGDLDLSRVILGGNLMNGFAHARDLTYVSTLIKAYHSVDKVLETLWLAEQCGMNTLIVNTFAGGHFVEAYHKRNVGGFNFIAQCVTKDLIPRIKAAIDLGVKAAYIQGIEVLTEKEEYDKVAEALDLMRSNGLVAGIGSHYLWAVKACVEQGIEVDFCMKTFHHLNYWSALPDEPPKDNRYCEDEEETIEFMKDFDKPWIAFKTLAAGAIHPKDGFRHAFENGADFVCAGMYDFQVVDNANIACRILNADLKRQRPWQAMLS